MPILAKPQTHTLNLLFCSLPVAFYVKLFGHELTAREKLGCYAIMAASTSLSVVGTVWAFLPKSYIGAD